MSVIIDFSIFPMDKGGSDLSSYVARVIRIISDSGLAYKLGPMGTAIEGEWEDVMKVVNDCYKAVEKDAERIYLNIRADCRRGRTGGLSGKVASVENKLKD